MGSVGANKNNPSVLKDENSFYKSLEKVSRNVFGKNSKDDYISDMIARDDRNFAEKVLQHFKENNIPLLTINQENGYPEWQFTGNNKYGKNGKEWTSFELEGPSKENVINNLRLNGYTVRHVLPLNLYRYAVDHTDMDPDQMRVLNAIGTAVIKQWRQERRK